MWAKPPAPLRLSSGTVHLWKANLKVESQSETGFRTLLSDEEQLRADRFRFSEHRRRFTVARGMLRRLLGYYLHQSPEKIALRYGPFGKPFLSRYEFLKFNLSHADDLALFGFALDHEIGIDLERINTGIEFQQLARHFFARKEMAMLLELPPEQRLQGFFNCWNRKEAFVKAKGEGLSFPLDQFEVSLKPGEPARILATNWDPDEKAEWSLFSFDPAPDFLAALAIRGKIMKVEYLSWDEISRP